ncbi:MAG: DNA-directed DNA polymerase [Candidatus Aenigmarchaeota archaeon]|nr:DNA-directed DNA polymerase [Candidatus Aenigmarchaeota archaeon]
MREKVFLLDVDYDVENERGVIFLFGKNKEGKRILVKKEFYTYFFAMPKEGKEEILKQKIESLKNLPTKILSVDIITKNWMGNERRLVKITIQNPRKLKDVRDAIKDWEEVENTFEYNISFYKRFLMDYRIKPCSWIEVEGNIVENKFDVDLTIEAKEIKQLDENEEPQIKVLAVDTEWVEIEDKEKLIMISLASEKLRKVLALSEWQGKQEFVESYASEERLIKRFLEIVKQERPDIIVTYNGDGFDFLKLREKAKQLKIKFGFGIDGKELEFVRRGRASAARCFGVVHIDEYVFVDKILSASLKSEILTLDEVASELIGEGKKELEYKQMVEFWKERKELNRIAEYSMWDAHLTYLLSQILLPQIFSLSRLVGEIPFDTSRYTYSQLVEAYLMKKAVEDNVLIPNSPKTEEKESRMRELPYKGAVVVEPKKGIHENIAVMDFRSLYPTIIISHSISPELLNCGHEECKEKNTAPETRNHFCIKKVGFIPKHLKFLIDRRKELKEKMKKLPKNSPQYKILDNEQYATKIISNAMYGYFGFVGARWYKKECGEATAAWGRFYIRKIMQMAQEAGLEIIYGDTDSIFVKKEGLNLKEIEEEAKKFVEKVNKELPGIIELEFRGVYTRGIFVAREKGESGAKKRYALLDLSGNLEIRGFETVRRDWCKLAKETQRKVLEIVLKEKDPEKAVQFVTETIKRLKEGKVDIEELTIYEQITKPLNQYEQIGPHVKAAMKAREKGKIVTEGSIIAFVITKGSGSISDRAMPVEFVTRNDYDADYYIKHQILPAALRVLKALGYTEENILKPKTPGLGMWLKNSKH